ncbi:MAG: 30S ribosomal protein S6 [Spirochaetes bacterium]|nr:30S ribosomal protein S6 [Spirochaetota bacterium]
MRKYELMIIFDEEEIPLSDNKSTLAELFTKNKVDIKEEKDIGQKDLSFPINEKKRGHYYLYTIECEQEVLNNLESVFKLNKGIMRYLIVRQ